MKLSDNSEEVERRNQVLTTLGESIRFTDASFTKHGHGYVLTGDRHDGRAFLAGVDPRGYLVAVGFEKFWYNDVKDIRVYAGCRIFTLDQALKHWAPSRKHSTYRAPQCKAIRMAILAALVRAQYLSILTTRARAAIKRRKWH